MSQPTEIVHHQSVRCSARGPVLRDTDWDRVTCDECLAKRQRNKRTTKFLALGCLGVFVLLFVGCLAIVLATGRDGASTDAPSATGVKETLTVHDKANPDIRVTTGVKQMTIGEITAYPEVLDAAITQEGRDLSLVVVVGFATTEEQAKKLGDNFVRLVKTLSQDVPPGKDIGTGMFNYLVGVYYPDEKVVALGAKARTAINIRW